MTIKTYTDEIFGMPHWYPALANYTFTTSFVKLRPEEIQALASGETTDGDAVRNVISRLSAPMNVFMGNSFVTVDSLAPTDTGRFNSKRGAVYSPESAWKTLARSEKIKKAAAEGRVNYICIKPFRRMNRIREFRLFIKDGKLKGMSQYWLTQHFKRLDDLKAQYWKMAKDFVSETAWLFPVKDLTVDIYFTSSSNIMIIDLNPWGGDTQAKLFNTWDRDWTEEPGIKILSPPVRISGEVNVSF